MIFDDSLVPEMGLVNSGLAISMRIKSLIWAMGLLKLMLIIDSGIVI